MPEPRPQTDHAQAIEAGARAVAANWRETGGWQDQTTYQTIAAAAYSAMAPLIRLALAEEIAAKIERSYSYDHEPQPIPNGRRELIEKVAGWCARIAREIGERHA